MSDWNCKCPRCGCDAYMGLARLSCSSQPCVNYKGPPPKPKSKVDKAITPPPPDAPADGSNTGSTTTGNCDHYDSFGISIGGDLSGNIGSSYSGNNDQGNALPCSCPDCGGGDDQSHGPSAPSCSPPDDDYDADTDGY